MERENIKVTTPTGKQEIVLKAWLTGKERREIRSVLLDEVKFGQSDDGEATPEYNIQGSVLNLAQDKAFEVVVISVDGNTEKLVETILNMRDTDTEFIVKEIDKITGGIDEETKKK